MEERLENKTSEDIDGVSGKLFLKISTEIFPALTCIYNLIFDTNMYSQTVE